MRLLPLMMMGLIAVGCGDARPRTRLSGAGSSFIDPMMQEWASAYQKGRPVEVSYQSKGSGAGIKAMTARDVDFGCSDAPLNDEQLKTCQDKHGDVLHVPLCMGAIVPAYNLPDVPGLVFDGKTLIEIFTGRVTRWDDPMIAKLNPGVKLPAEMITVARRSDASGSTYIFTDYLTKVDAKAWSPGRGTEVKWLTGTGAKGNDGVAALIKQTRGTIGYVELIYALENKLPFGKMVNAAGQTVAAETKAVTAAAATADVPDDLRYSITNAPGADAWPIAGTVWAIAYANQPEGRGAALKDFLTWVTHEGQTMTDELHYAPLPPALVKKVEAQLTRLK